MKTIYELVEYEENIPAKIILKDMDALEFQVPAHWHESVEFDLMTKGSAVCVTNGISEEVTPGNFMFINSEEIHSIEVNDKKGRYCSAVVLLSYDFLRRQFKDIDRYFFAIPPDSSAPEEIRQILACVKEVYAAKLPFYRTRLNSLLSQLSYILLSQCLVQKKPQAAASLKSQDICAKKAITYVNENYMEKISISGIADYVGLQENYFCRYFKQKTGDTFLRFLNKVRLYHALEQYLNEDTTVLDCAMRNGFASSKAFEKACREIHGCTPAQLRRRG